MFRSMCGAGKLVVFTSVNKMPLKSNTQNKMLIKTAAYPITRRFPLLGLPVIVSNASEKKKNEAGSRIKPMYCMRKMRSNSSC